MAARLRADADVIEAWQRTRDKCTSSGPYPDGQEVGFLDQGRRDVTEHRSKASACADFLSAKLLGFCFAEGSNPSGVVSLPGWQCGFPMKAIFGKDEDPAKIRDA